MKNRQLRSPRIFILLLLFTFPLLIRCLWAFDACPVPYLTPDEFLYPFAGKLYLQGLSSGNFSVFKISPAHPPLSKLITAVFIFMLGPIGFSDIYALRMQSCIFSALTCVIVYLIASRMNRKAGLLSWALLSLDPLSIQYTVASLDVTSLFFASTSIYVLLSYRQDSARRYFLFGLFVGLATLCKYPAFPILMGAFLLILFKEGICLGSLVRKVSIVAVCSIAVVLVGNPLFWPPQLIGFPGYLVVLGDTAGYAVTDASSPVGFVITSLDWFEAALRGWNTPYVLFYLSMFVHGVLIYPLPLFQSSYLPWLLLGSLIERAKRKVVFDDLAFKTLLWFSSGFILFWLLAKSQAEPYYGIWLQPALAIFSSSFVVNVWRYLKR